MAFLLIIRIITKMFNLLFAFANQFYIDLNGKDVL